jgi:Domain of unknown function (DUF4145)
MLDENVLSCPSCNFAVTTIEIAKYETTAQPIPNQFIIDESEISTQYYEYILRSCAKCGSPFLLKNECINHFEAGNYIQSQEMLYPLRYSDAITLGKIPESITKIYAQAKECFRNSLFEPSVIMTRKCLEAICKDLGASGKSLAEKIDNLKTTKMVNEKLVLWATELRLIGNDAAHDLDIVISKQDAEDSLAFLNAMLLYIYTLEQKFNDFLSRRGKA